MGNRIEKLRVRMQEANLSALIVTDPFNLNYLSRFDGLAGDGCLVVTIDAAWLITDNRYQVAMEERLAGSSIELTITRDYCQTAAQKVADITGAVGFEGTLAYATAEQLRTLVGERLVSTTDLVEQMRYIKDDSEIAILSKSCDLASNAYAALLKFVRAGMTERRLERFLYDWMLEHGASGPSFNTIVASGARSALPHASASDKTLQPGELVTVDFGFYYRGYTSDMTRTFAIGDPGPELKHVYAIVREAQVKMIQAMHGGADGNDVDAAARDFIGAQGYGQYFQHGSGHEIGLAIHEHPILGPTRHCTIQPGFVLTAEPGIYLPGKGGVRIEDDVLVTSEGHYMLTKGRRGLKIITRD